MQVFFDISEMRNQIRIEASQGRSIGLIYLEESAHKGHIKLIEQAMPICDRLVVTLFKVPRFRGAEDKTSSEQLKEQISILEGTGCHFFFSPLSSSLIPSSRQPNISINLDSQYEVESQCLQFASMQPEITLPAVILAKLFNILSPDYYITSYKNPEKFVFQRFLLSDLRYPIKLVTFPVSRQDNGMAHQVSNLSDEEKDICLKMHNALDFLKAQFKTGLETNDQILDCLDGHLVRESLPLDRCHILRKSNFEPFKDRVDESFYLGIAAQLTDRLIWDTILVEAN